MTVTYLVHLIMIHCSVLITHLFLNVILGVGRRLDKVSDLFLNRNSQLAVLSLLFDLINVIEEASLA